MAVAGVVLGLLWLGGLGSILAVTFGIIGLVETGSPLRRGRPVAVASLVLGVVGIVTTLTGLLVVSVPDRTARPASTTPTSTTLVSGTTLRPIPAADQARCTAEAQLLEFGAQTYEAVNGHFPTTLADLSGVGVGISQITLYAIDPSGGTTAFHLVPTAAGRAAGCSRR